MATVFSSSYLRPGRGTVPGTPLLAAAWKQLLEIPGVKSCGALANGLGTQLDFTAEGVTVAEFRAFFTEALEAAKKVEPIVEAGNKYSVSSDFKKLNGDLLVYELQHSPAYQALSGRNQLRAMDFFEFVCCNGELRNRNPLHPNPLDSAVIGNLVNFPKHIFGFPYAGYSTNGNEALSLVLFGYRHWHKKGDPHVVYVTAHDEEGPMPDIEACAIRMGMKFYIVTDEEFRTGSHLCQAAVVMTSFTNKNLGKVAEIAERAGVAVHIHLLDSQLRSIFANNLEPVHFELPNGIRSMSLQDGLFRSGYQLYRDTYVRDVHFDVPFEWQSQYISPNEGGSGNSTPLYIDLCFILLGWYALRDITSATLSKATERLEPMKLPVYQANDSMLQLPKDGNAFDGVVSWAKASMNLPRSELERMVFQFQRNFVGGKNREVEALVSGGGTRSINFAFETVIARARAALGVDARIKVVTGNPHLAVERAQRRFQFDVVRVQKDGAICLDGLQREIRDLKVAAVYVQTLSITDGITDPLREVLEIIEEENKRRLSKQQMPVVLINDSCLALSVLLHNDGQNGSKNLRVLDLSETCITPTIVMLDAHKHIGADKGISMAMGTPGTLSTLQGHVRVGAGPTNGELVRAMADMALVGVDGYHEKYRKLVSAIEQTTQTIESSGMKIVHAHNRAKGSTAFGVEDPSACIYKKLKKKGHGPAPLYRIMPSCPNRCQTGWLLSLTPHCLRQIKPDKTALDVFTSDLMESKKTFRYPSLAKLFSENSLPGFLLSGGNEELWVFARLHFPGAQREVVSLVLRRIYSAILDSGVVCTKRHHNPLKVVLQYIAFAVFLILALRLRRTRMLKR